MCLVKVLIVTSLGKITEFIALIGGDDNSIYFMVAGDGQRYKDVLALLQEPLAPTIGMLFECQPSMAGHSNFYSKEMELYGNGLTSATRNIKRAIVDIHFCTHMEGPTTGA